jgi:hypothetical protein
VVNSFAKRFLGFANGTTDWRRVVDTAVDRRPSTMMVARLSRANVGGSVVCTALVEGWGARECRGSGC